MSVEKPILWKQRLTRIADRLEQLKECKLVVIRNVGEDAKTVKTVHDEAIGDNPRIQLSEVGGVSCGYLGVFLVPTEDLPADQVKKLHSDYYQMFHAAGSAIDIMPETILTAFDPILLQFKSVARWAGVLTHIAIRKIKGMTLQSSRTYTGVRLNDILSDGEQRPPVPRCFYVEIDKPVWGSLELIDSMVTEELPPIIDDSSDESDGPDTGVLDDGGTVSWHGPSETPDKDIYPSGPLTGTKKQLAKWILGDRKNKKPERPLNTAVMNGTYWGRDDGAGQFAIYFRTQQRFSEANSQKLKDMHENSGQPRDTKGRL